MHKPISALVAASILVVAVLACRSPADRRISFSNTNSSVPAPSPTGKLKKGDRVRIFDHTGTLINFIPRGDDVLAAVVRTDEEIIFETVRGNIVIMQLRYVGAEWGGGRDMDRIVGAELCPSGPQYPDVPSWFKNAKCIQLDFGLTYDVL